MKRVPWLRQIGVSFVWDLPSGVRTSGPKKKDLKTYDHADKDTRKTLGKEIKTVLNEVCGFRDHVRGTLQYMIPVISPKMS